MTQQTISCDQFTECLALLERLHETPVVAGEMQEWLDRVQSKLGELATLHAEYVKSTHEQQLATIVDRDAELVTRVEKMRSEDADIQQELIRLQHVSSEAAGKLDVAEQVEQLDDAPLATVASKLSDSVLALIIRARLQDNALRTWFVEAFQRDRGVSG